MALHAVHIKLLTLLSRNLFSCHLLITILDSTLNLCRRGRVSGQESFFRNFILLIFGYSFSPVPLTVGNRRLHLYFI